MRFKKSIVSVLILSFVLVCLSACGNEKADDTKAEAAVIDKSDKDNYIGKWQYVDDYFIQIDKGGIATYGEVANPNKGYYSMTWEIVDDVLALDYNSSVLNARITLELTDDGTALKQIAGDFPKRKTDKATFSKVA